jgi:hypothetical protein
MALPCARWKQQQQQQQQQQAAVRLPSPVVVEQRWRGWRWTSWWSRATALYYYRL